MEAQRRVAENYVTNKGLISEEFTDIESDKNDSRKELAKAISLANQKGATLLIAKLDRLSKNLTFISSIMDSGVNFLCCDLPEANEFTIHIFAALAQQERKMISARTKVALEAKKLAGAKLGAPHHLTYEHRVKGGKIKQEQAMEKRSNKQAAKIIVRLRKEGWTLAAIAQELNSDGYQTSMGKQFKPMSVKRLFDRYA
ncbi:recombinase family protein [Rhodocytophaga aerolata]|uniref:Recombinase family protein n=1 Tax=Rhodocytophaga aerolata TaxID=455078 RepID=A0ABT8RHW9_9BACT|nr:recombinase family protein [Rhodocytophaga aerolata]MDO1451316.1 recombinase family protein [Rhodocytophaga aerolata]